MRSGIASPSTTWAITLPSPATERISPCRPMRRALDYELELGFVLAHRCSMRRRLEAERAIGGFVVSTTSARATCSSPRWRSGFGPQKSKHFRSAMSKVVVTADEILPRWHEPQGQRTPQRRACRGDVDGGRALVARRGAGACLARGGVCMPGELFATGTLPRWQRHRERPAARAGRRHRDRHRRRGHAAQPHRRREAGVHEGHRSIEADPLQSRRPVASCGCTVRHKPH